MTAPNILNPSTPRFDLAAAIWQFNQQTAKFIAGRVFPGINVEEDIGSVDQVLREDILRDDVKQRASGAGYARSGFTLDGLTYRTKEYGLEIPLDLVKKKSLSKRFDSELGATRVLMGKLLINREIRVQSQVQNTSNFTGDNFTDVSATPWNNASTGVPINDVQDASEKIEARTGFEGNCLIINKKTWSNLSLNGQIVDRLGGAHSTALLGGLLNLEALALVLAVEKILVGRAVHNTADEGKTFVGSSIWETEFATLAWIPQIEEGADLDIEEATMGRSFFWEEFSTKEEEVFMESYAEAKVNSEVIRGTTHVDEKLIDVAYGQLIKIQ